MRSPEQMVAEASQVVDTNPTRAIALSLIALAEGLVVQPRQDLAAHEVCEAVEEFFTAPSDENHTRLMSAWHEWRATLT